MKACLHTLAHAPIKTTILIILLFAVSLHMRHNTQRAEESVDEKKK